MKLSYRKRTKDQILFFRANWDSRNFWVLLSFWGIFQLQVTLKNFLWVIWWCPRYLKGCPRSGLSNARCLMSVRRTETKRHGVFRITVINCSLRHLLDFTCLCKKLLGTLIFFGWFRPCILQSTLVQRERESISYPHNYINFVPAIFVPAFCFSRNVVPEFSYSHKYQFGTRVFRTRILL